MKISDDGKIEIIPGFGAYSGKPYRHVDEFDAFAIHYERSKYKQANVSKKSRERKQT
ncbi:MAG: hypothetical protein ABJA67_17345 [Chthonomonadales bacterium]